MYQGCIFNPYGKPAPQGRARPPTPCTKQPTQAVTTSQIGQLPLGSGISFQRYSGIPLCVHHMPERLAVPDATSFHAAPDVSMALDRHRYDSDCLWHIAFRRAQGHMRISSWLLQPCHCRPPDSITLGISHLLAATYLMSLDVDAMGLQGEAPHYGACSFHCTSWYSPCRRPITPARCIPTSRTRPRQGVNVLLRVYSTID